MFPGNMQVQTLVFSMPHTEMKQYTSVSRTYWLICGHKVLKMNYDEATSWMCDMFVLCWLREVKLWYRFLNHDVYYNIYQVFQTLVKNYFLFSNLILTCYKKYFRPLSIWHIYANFYKNRFTFGPFFFSIFKVWACIRLV